jgi:hypothetical protein
MLRRDEFVRCVGLEPGECTVLDGEMGMFFVAIPLDCAAFVVRRMVATIEDTADITRAIFSVTLVSEMVTSAFDASRFG